MNPQDRPARRFDEPPAYEDLELRPPDGWRTPTVKCLDCGEYHPVSSWPAEHDAESQPGGDMNIRFWLGEQVSRLADWLRYPQPLRCIVCGYAEDGVHSSPDECEMCKAEPRRRVEHHEFVAPSFLDRLRGRAA